MKNRLEDLRNHLFAALEGLADEKKPMDIERAKAIADVGRVVIEGARTELAFLQLRNAPTNVDKAAEVPTIPVRPRLSSGAR